MQVHVKTPHTRVIVEGTISQKLLNTLKEEYGDNVIIREGDDELIQIEDTEWFKTVDQNTTKGQILTYLRENRELTRKQLSQKIGVSESRLGEYENDKYPISKKVALKLSKELGTSVEEFL